MNDSEPKCPFNHFGRGVNFVVPQEEKFLAQYEKDWEAWENEHPDDLSGETAWNEWKARQVAKPSIREITMPVAPAPEYNVAKLEVRRRDPEETDDLIFAKPSGVKQMYRFNLPVELHERLKAHCERTGRQMSPVIRQLIEDYLNNGH